MQKVAYQPQVSGHAVPLVLQSYPLYYTFGKRRMHKKVYVILSLSRTHTRARVRARTHTHTHTSCITVHFGPCEEDGSSVWEWEFYSGQHSMSKRTWGTGIVKVMKRERNHANALALGGKCWKDRSGRFTRGRALQTNGCASWDKIVYWYCSLNISGYQLYDNWSDIILSRLLHLPI
jgi:hypothetical protein